MTVTTTASPEPELRLGWPLPAGVDVHVLEERLMGRLARSLPMSAADPLVMLDERAGMAYVEVTGAPALDPAVLAQLGRELEGLALDDDAYALRGDGGD
jgi:hypothetical protein